MKAEPEIALAKIAYRNLRSDEREPPHNSSSHPESHCWLNKSSTRARQASHNYINKFWGRTDIVVSYGAFPPVFDRVNLAKVMAAPEITRRLRLVWLGALNKTVVQIIE